jgi:flavin reductase (DIM6/NTAB) family NADH-FMN oxidoreductase RutF
MHCFQPFSLDYLDMNPFKKLSKEWALVSTGNKKVYNTMTVSWGGFGVLWGKNVAYIFIRESRYSKELIDKGEFFSISFLDEADREALNYCGKHSGREGDKFAAAGLTAAFRHDIPYPDEANLIILCNKLAAIPISAETFCNPQIEKKWYSDHDMHTMYVGEIIEAAAR